MINAPLPGACIALLAVGLVSFSNVGQDDHADELDHGEHAADSHGAAPEVPPHTRAPQNISLEVHEGTWLVAPGEDWFEAQAELEPGRYSYDEELRDGDGAWVDSQGVFKLRFDEEEEDFAYWEYVSAERLTLGRRDFVQFCASCHGFEGDGYGRSGQYLRPAPRSFQQSNFKFTKIIKDLPSDEALIRLIKRGLDGTPMYPWDLSDEVLGDIVQYIKSLSPEGQGWRDLYLEIGGIVESSPDPWAGRGAEGVVRGEEIYHGKANCHLCHPGYVTLDRMREIRGDAADTQYRDMLTYPALKESDYDVLGKQQMILPPDFTWHTVRAGTTLQDLFETIASGIMGTAMPQWKGSLSDEEIWALAYYVQDLIETHHGRPVERAAFMASLRAK